MINERTIQKLAIFDFELTEEQMATIRGPDEGGAGRLGPEPDTFDWIPD